MSDDFFNSVPFSSQNTNKEESVDSFAQAIAARFGSADLLTARLLPDARKDNCKQKFQSHDDSPKDQSPSDCKPSENPPPSLNQSFTPVSPSELATYVSEHPTLTLDIRPHAAHASARIDHALSLSVPSTLLKRPLFSLCKLAQMIPSTTARSRFSAWPEASRILVYDADSTHLPHNSNIAGLLRKFRAEGFTGELGWIKGGFQAVWREARQLTTTEQPSPEDDDMDFGSGSGALRTKRLPKSAFSVTSTTLSSTAVSGDMSGVPQTPAPAVTRAANPFFDAIRQNVELSQGITERIPLRLPRRVRRRINDLPFAWLREIARRSTVRCFPSSTRIYGSESESSDEPYASDPDEHDPKVEEGTEALAMQFYRIELAEQRRLWTVMEHHSRENEMASTVKTVPNTPHPSSFPFAITAGVEKGAKNRYTHIWPFEHARVRLHDGSVRGQPSPQDDYVNASYVQPLGTRKKYIATQGPLPATFLDFWTLVWEQNVHVIVMLTREVENAMVKCGTYWTDTRYGPFRLELLSTSPPLSPSRPADCTETSKQGFFFALREPDASSRGRSAPTTIIRRFALSHTSYPGVPPRHITHLQYLDWPDLNVPDDPRGILDLVKRVESAVAESTPVGQVVHKKRGHGWRHPELDPATGIAASTLGKPHPVLLHCSAGVGRTGGFIAVDAVLDGIRRELRKVREKRAMTHSMDVDGLSANDGEPRPYAPVHQATAPIHVTAGERKKGRKHHGARATSSESLVVHVPIATAPRDADNGTTNTQLEKPRTASWKPSSTREWAEQVSDQTHTKDSGGSSSGNGDGKSTSGSVSGSGSSRACVPPSSSASISHGSGSVSASNSNSGNGSRTGSSSLENNSTGLSSVMRSRLADSSATSLSNISTGSPFPRSLKPLSGPGVIQQPSAVYRSSNARTDMDVDEPPRAVSVPPQRNPIIDYKLPRELHLDLSPPLLSSYQNPICMVVQDMREQRMSLCQSLRQYVFVHAAVIEGALQIVDEERELWGDSGGSDGGPELPPSPFSNAKGWVGSEAQEAWVEDGKRGPSPTELLKEDKTGALSLAKRPSVKRKAPSDDEIPSTLEGKTYPATGFAGAGIAVPFGAGPSAPKTGSWPGMAVE
ncbi:hypothetical protein EDD15DRAFT_2169147 [Pisolithus albus]|nr:hypothetical protein EDD15DRAFT_2169147 [Pisolithus albus]